MCIRDRLQFLLLAEKLSILEPDAQALIMDCFQEYSRAGEINWAMMKENLITLAGLKDHMYSAEQKADMIYHTLSEEYTKAQRHQFKVNG